jgi:hypothetical protein
MSNVIVLTAAQIAQHEEHTHRRQHAQRMLAFAEQQAARRPRMERRAS